MNQQKPASILLIALIGIMCFCIPSCTKKTTQYAPWIEDTNVCIGGSSIIINPNATNPSNGPTYWNYEGQNKLGNTLGGDNGIINKIKFINGVRYMVGTLNINGKLKGVMWADENVVPFTSPTADVVYVTDFDIEGQVIYACGYEVANGVSTAVYWKNGDRFVLASIINARANAIEVYDGKVSIGGGMYGANNVIMPVMWHNGVLVPLVINNNTFSEVTDLCELNGNTFATGIVGTSASHVALWINDDFRPVVEPNESIASEGNAIQVQYTNGEYITYIAGKATTVNETAPYYWIKDAPNALPKNSYSIVEANDIVFKNNDMYIAGSLVGTKIMPCYWKNGTFFSSETNSDNTQASAQYVTAIGVR
jgi:hypothetical protein